jgi:hypothetical protein
VLPRPVELDLGNSDGSTVCLSLSTTLGLAPRIPKDPTCEHHEGLVVCAEVAVPASRRAYRPAQRLREVGHDLLIYLELDDSPGKRLAGAHVTDISPAYLANLEDDTIKGVVLREALCDQSTRCVHVGIVALGCNEEAGWAER